MIFNLINLIRITLLVLKYCIWVTKHQLRIKMSRNHKMTRYDTGNPLWYCFLFPIFPMVLLLGLWCYFGWMHEKLVRCGATKAPGFELKRFFCKILTLEWRTVVFGYTNEINLLILLKTSVKSMNSVPISPHQIKFRMRTSNEIEEGSYVSYCKLDGGMFALPMSHLFQELLLIVYES